MSAVCEMQANEKKKKQDFSQTKPRGVKWTTNLSSSIIFQRILFQQRILTQLNK